MKLPAVLLVVGLAIVGCRSAPDPAEVKLAHQEADLVGAMARAPGPRSPAQVVSITACVTSLQAHIRSIAGETK